MFEYIKLKRKIHELRKRINTLESENKIQRETFEEATKEWAQQLLDKGTDIDYKNKQLDLKDNTIKKLKERIKELEMPKKKTKKVKE